MRLAAFSGLLAAGTAIGGCTVVPERRDDGGPLFVGDSRIVAPFEVAPIHKAFTGPLVNQADVPNGFIRDDSFKSLPGRESMALVRLLRNGLPRARTKATTAFAPNLIIRSSASSVLYIDTERAYIATDPGSFDPIGLNDTPAFRREIEKLLYAR